jgi:Family of unknown function (DUF6461)
VESNGYLGVTEEMLDRLSAGTRLVSHFRDVNAVDRFHLVDDGRVCLDFELLFAWYRSGCDADGYVDLILSVCSPLISGSGSTPMLCGWSRMWFPCRA